MQLNFAVVWSSPQLSQISVIVIRYQSLNLFTLSENLRETLSDLLHTTVREAELLTLTYDTSIFSMGTVITA